MILTNLKWRILIAWLFILFYACAFWSFIFKEVSK